MKSKSGALLLALLAALPGATARADETPVLLIPAIASQYLFRGVRLGGPSLQPTLEVDAGSLTAGLWANLPLKDKVPGQSDPELDPFASYNLTLTDAIGVAPGFTWYTFPRADSGRGFHRSAFEPNLAVNYTIRGIRFTPKLAYNFALRGAVYEFNVSLAVPLTTLGTELDWNATAGTFLFRDAVNHAAPAVKNWGDYYLVGVTVPFTISRASRVALGISYTKGSANYLKAGQAPRMANPAAVGRVVVTLSYLHRF